ncbi:MAG: transporter substrate-binding domain-containing protein [Gammaproteobacteria bacterium]|nr:transporter substrate-binding domain-containing protein [Gammaproteobacteria bacterium]
MCFFLVFTSVQAEETIKIATRQDFLLSESYVEVLTEAYRRINTPVEFVYLPGGSSLKLSSNRDFELDGEAGRLAGVLKKYTNLRKIPVPINLSRIMVFSHDPALKISSWEDLKNLNVVTRIGFKVVLDTLHQHNIPIRALENSQQAIQMVHKERADVAVLNEIDGIDTINRLQLQNVSMNRKPLLELPIFHLLHKDHGDLINKLIPVLKDMEREGVLADIARKYTPVMNNQ